jgi:hypothetical protein
LHIIYRHHQHGENITNKERSNTSYSTNRKIIQFKYYDWKDNSMKSVPDCLIFGSGTIWPSCIYLATCSTCIKLVRLYCDTHAVNEKKACLFLCNSFDIENDAPHIHETNYRRNNYLGLHRDQEHGLLVEHQVLI